MTVNELRKARLARGVDPKGSRNGPALKKKLDKLDAIGAPVITPALAWSMSADVEPARTVKVYNSEVKPRAKTADFNAGDIGYAKRGQGHYIQNTGTTELRLVAVFKVPQYEEVSLSAWLTHTPPELVSQHLNIDPTMLAKFPNHRPGIIPE